MIRPRKMKRVELTILDRDVDRVIEFLGQNGLLHVAKDDEAEAGRENRKTDALDRTNGILDRIRTMTEYLGLDFPQEPEADAGFPGEVETGLVERIAAGIDDLRKRERESLAERQRVAAALNEIQAFENLDVPFRDLDQLSYLTIRVGLVDPKRRAGLAEALGDRALIIPLGQDGGQGRIIAAASRKGRFALDSELKRQDFVPAAIPEDSGGGVPPEILTGMKDRIAALDGELEAVAGEKARFREEWGTTVELLASAFLVAAQVERLKGELRGTASVYLLSGWTRADGLKGLARSLGQIAGGRVAIRAWTPEELPSVASGTEQVPVSLQHGALVQSFARLVFSYGAPLYGTIDPTPFVAFFFIVLFGIMFGDLGQGLVLLLLGVLVGRKGPKFLSGFRNFSVPLMAVGVSSMMMGFLSGEVFTVEGLLVRPTRAVAGFFMALFGMPGEPPGRILHLMPESGSVAKLFYFFGFTLSLGVLLNSAGLVVNIVNLCLRKKYEKAFFSRTGVAGLLFFWYAVFIAVRMVLGGRFAWYDAAGIALPLVFVFFGPPLWRLFSGERPVLEEGFLVFVMEGFVELLEIVSTCISNTVSFLRVGAFALSHAVLSFIVFTLSEMMMSAPVGFAASALILVAGNAVIIVLEGMIVAIQVVRLQYYEFFSKFFTETGLAFSPFRFRRGEET